MAEAEAIQPFEPVTGVQEELKVREKSTIEFPYLDLEDSTEVAKAVHEVGGGECRLEQLAARLNMAVTGGGFRLRLIAAKTFGVIQYNRDSVMLTPLGTRLCDPQQEKQAKVDAFLKVPLYLQVYEKYKGVTLPQSAGLEQAMVTMGVVTKQKDKARQVFQRSANQAGFFSYGPDRLTMPSIKGGESPQTKPVDDARDEDRDREKTRKNSGNGGGTYHPFIEGLLKTLPEAETPWEIEKRLKWLQAAANIFDLIYSASDDSKRLSIKVESSA